jgi:hypothetical protein
MHNSRYYTGHVSGEAEEKQEKFVSKIGVGARIPKGALIKTNEICYLAIQIARWRRIEAETVQTPSAICHGAMVTSISVQTLPDLRNFKTSLKIGIVTFFEWRRIFFLTVVKAQ